MLSPAEIIATRTVFLGVTNADIDASIPKLDKRIAELSALSPDQAQAYASTMWSLDEIEGPIIQEAKAQHPS